MLQKLKHNRKKTGLEWCSLALSAEVGLILMMLAMSSIALVSVRSVTKNIDHLSRWHEMSCLNIEHSFTAASQGSQNETNFNREASLHFQLNEYKFTNVNVTVALVFDF